LPPKLIFEGKVEGNIQVTGRRGTKHKLLLDEFKERRRYWKLKGDAVDGSQWRIRFGRLWI